MDKISCGGFYLGEGLFVDIIDGKPVLNVNGAGGNIRHQKVSKFFDATSSSGGSYDISNDEELMEALRNNQVIFASTGTNFYGVSCYFKDEVYTYRSEGDSAFLTIFTYDDTTHILRFSADTGVTIIYLRLVAGDEES